MLNRALLNRSLSFILLLSILQIPIFPAQANEVSGNGAYKLIDLQAARDAGIDGTGWVIASIDSGVQTDNPYIKDAILDDGYCFASGNGCSDGSSEMSGPGAGASAKNSDGTWRKDTTHGTATAGVAVGRPNKNALGGVAPGAKFFPINNQGNKNNLDFGGVLKGLERIYELRNKYKFAAIYISQGGWALTRSQFNNCNSQFKQEAEIISKLRKEGIPVIVASGNGSNTDGVNSISCVEDAISVGGVNSDGTIHYQSNIGSKVELLSPYCSNSSDYPENYSEFCGTSGSAPLVAGTFALMRQANPSLSVEEILKILKKTGTPTSDINYKQLPIINIQRALDAALCPNISPKITKFEVISGNQQAADIQIEFLGKPSKMTLLREDGSSEKLEIKNQVIHINNNKDKNIEEITLSLADENSKVINSRTLSVLFPKDTHNLKCTPTGNIDESILPPLVYSVKFSRKNNEIVLSTMRGSLCFFAEIKDVNSLYSAFGLRIEKNAGYFGIRLPENFDFAGNFLLKITNVNDNGNYSKPIEIYINSSTLNEIPSAELESLEKQGIYKNDDPKLDGLPQLPILNKFDESHNMASDRNQDIVILESLLAKCNVSFPNIDSVSYKSIDSLHNDLEWQTSIDTYAVRVTPEGGTPIYLDSTIKHMNIEMLTGESQRGVLVEALDEKLVSISRKYISISIAYQMKCIPTGKLSGSLSTPLLESWEYFAKSGNLILKTSNPADNGCLYIEISQEKIKPKVNIIVFDKVYMRSNLVLTENNFIDRDNSVANLKMTYIDSAGNMSFPLSFKFITSMLFSQSPNQSLEDLGNPYRNTNQLYAEMSKIPQDSIFDKLAYSPADSPLSLKSQDFKLEVASKISLESEIQKVRSNLNLALIDLNSSKSTNSSLQKSADETAIKFGEAILAFNKVQNELMQFKESSQQLLLDKEKLINTQNSQISQLMSEVAALKKKLPTTITCYKGNIQKKVTAILPKCPIGYKIKLK